MSCQCKPEEDLKTIRAIIISALIGLVVWAVVLYVVCMSCGAKAYAYTDQDVVNAIYKAEHSPKFPYGIKSIRTHSEKHARKICFRSVKNARRRWLKAGKPCDFINFMGFRYSPPAINPNWTHLVKHFLEVKAGA